MHAATLAGGIRNDELRSTEGHLGRNQLAASERAFERRPGPALGRHLQRTGRGYPRANWATVGRGRCGTTPARASCARLLPVLRAPRQRQEHRAAEPSQSVPSCQSLSRRVRRRSRGLDVHNLRYQDILLHLAAKLAEQLDAAAGGIDPIHLEPLYDWFTERVEKREQTKQFAQESKAGVEAAPSVPFLAKVFGSISVAFKTNASYKEELRFVLQNYFADFADAFNKLVATAEEILDQRLLFVVDGTDRLHVEDAAAFFGADVCQLQQLKGLFIYCAPIHLACKGGRVAQEFDKLFHLPMVKVENEDGSPNKEGLRVMRRMLELRADSKLFDAGVADRLVRISGGHPRELLRLLMYARRYAESERFDAASADRAISALASDYRRFLKREDYRVLASIDAGIEVDMEDANRLLHELALLEYNNFYQRSHPVVRTTDEYKRAAADLGRSEGPS